METDKAIIEKVMEKIFANSKSITTDSIKILYMAGRVSPKEGWIRAHHHKQDLFKAIKKALYIKQTEILKEIDNFVKYYAMPLKERLRLKVDFDTGESGHKVVVLKKLKQKIIEK